MRIAGATMAVADRLDAAFFTDTWRRRPVLWRGAAADFAVGPVDDELVEQWIASPTPLPHVRRTGPVTFIEGIAAPAVAPLLAEVKELFGTGDVWCDLVRTDGIGSIGPHLDDSDNFVVHLSGVKQWRLLDAALVPAEQRSRRLLGDVTAAAHPVTTPTWECIARPGDVLYLPLAWPHHGIARTASLSLSLVVKATSTARARAEALFAELAQQPGGAEPVELGPTVARRGR